MDKMIQAITMYVMIISGILAAVLLGVAALLIFAPHILLAALRCILIAVCAITGVYMLYIFIRCLSPAVSIVWTSVKHHSKERFPVKR